MANWADSRRLMILPFSLAAALAACGDETQRLGDVTIMRGDSESRVVYTVPAPGDSGGEQRRQIICTEPSPDVAKAVGQAFQLDTGLNATVPTGGGTGTVDARLALALSRSHAEAMMQMTERLATIQLLRDGLYRACEAYSNGAINPTTYAVMISRYGDTMITMLMAELAAGNFGRQLATLGVGAGAGGEAGVQVPSGGTVTATAETQTAAVAMQAAAELSRNGSLPTDTLRNMLQAYLGKRNTDAVMVACVTELANDRPNHLTDFCEQYMPVWMSAAREIVAAGLRIEAMRAEAELHRAQPAPVPTKRTGLEGAAADRAGTAPRH